jgi:hypothetical protein
MSKKGLIKIYLKSNHLLFFSYHLVFDNLNNLYKRLSVLALEQQQQQQSVNTGTVGTSNTLQSISSTSTTMSRHGSIFYDAPEALSVILLNEDKDEIDKMVSNQSIFFFSLLFLFFSRIRNPQVVVMMKVIPMTFLVNRRFHLKSVRAYFLSIPFKNFSFFL